MDLEFKNSKLYRESFSKKEIGRFFSNNCTFLECDFSNSRIDSACFGLGNAQSVYKNCRFDHSTIFAPTPGEARFEACSFLNIELGNFFSTSIELVDCIFSGVIRKGFLYGQFEDIDDKKQINEISGNDFRNTRFFDFEFRQIELRAQKLPKNNDCLTIYDFEQFCNRIISEIAKETQCSIASDVHKFIDFLRMDNVHDSKQIFLERKDYNPEDDIALDYIFSIRDLLRESGLIE